VLSTPPASQANLSQARLWATLHLTNESQINSVRILSQTPGSMLLQDPLSLP
jgi:hypothetical protein